MFVQSNVFRFTTQLKENNNREWFLENKEWYDAVRVEFEKLVTRIIEEISKFDEEIKFLTPKDCMYRIYRDIRFSPDKTPYKVYLGAYMAKGGKKSKYSGYYFHLEPGNSFISVGIWSPEPPLLKALRQSVYDNIEELNEIFSAPDFTRYFRSFSEEDKLKKIPKDFPKDFPEAELLKLKHYYVVYRLDEKLLSSNDFLPQIIERYKSAYPLNQFLNYTVDELKG